ncbi:hypothetical protein AXG93_1175s1630 [Marchantia polymorpha subsp. ruderalis]|uniref:Uncharacterized protein n=1 Tax=Marchantia polymorpha subsp. ruderalis TaxID=1480154 RepID=A0A176VPC0_MARPO|nr:hypothetical protein AXG93_1175s1630 [Marchantia polymorpha subsp. ruderalis]
MFISCWERLSKPRGTPRSTIGALGILNLAGTCEGGREESWNWDRDGDGDGRGKSGHRSFAWPNGSLRGWLEQQQQLRNVAPWDDELLRSERRAAAFFPPLSTCTNRQSGRGQGWNGSVPVTVQDEFSTESSTRVSWTYLTKGLHSLFPIPVM